MRCVTESGAPEGYEADGTGLGELGGQQTQAGQCPEL